MIELRAIKKEDIAEVSHFISQLKSKADKPLFKAFQRAGFLRLRVERPGEIVLAKFTDDTYVEKTHYIHLVKYQGELWKNLIFFRDYLNVDEAARNRYLQIKQEYLKKSSAGIEAYTEFKENFVKEITGRRETGRRDRYLVPGLGHF